MVRFVTDHIHADVERRQDSPCDVRVALWSAVRGGSGDHPNLRWNALACRRESRNVGQLDVTGMLPNMRLKLAGALVLKEPIVSCPGGHGTVVHFSCAGGRVARSLSAFR